MVESVDLADVGRSKSLSLPSWVSEAARSQYSFCNASSKAERKVNVQVS